MKYKHITLIFCHGWAYTLDVFAQLIIDLKHQLQQDKYSYSINIYNLDLGFFTNSNNLYNSHEFITELNIKSILEKSITSSTYNNHHIIWVGHSYGLMHGKLYYSNYIHKYIGINSLLEFSSYKTSIKAMLRQIKSGNIKEVLHNFYIWCEDNNQANLWQNNSLNIANTNNIDNINIAKLALCLENMYAAKDEIWFHSTNKISILINKYDAFKFDNKNSININLKEVEYMQNPHILPKVAIDICVDFILSTLSKIEV